MDLLVLRDVQLDITQAIIFVNYVLPIASTVPLQYSVPLAKHHIHYMQENVFKIVQIKQFQCPMD